MILKILSGCSVSFAQLTAEQFLPFINSLLKKYVLFVILRYLVLGLVFIGSDIDINVVCLMKYGVHFHNFNCFYFLEILVWHRSLNYYSFLLQDSILGEGIIILYRCVCN